MKHSLFTFAAISAMVVGATSCGPSNSNPVAVSNGTGGYIQIERLARPAIKEATENFANHDTTNRVSPESATTDSVLANSITSFDTTVAKRSAAHAAILQSVLIPDEIAADLSKNGSAGYLGIETGGASGPVKSAFGGRALSDDVIDLDLYAVFGTAFSDLGLISAASAGAASPCLTTDNVSAAQGQATDGISATFPYVGAPH